MAWGMDLSDWRLGMVGSAYGRVSGSRDADLRLGWRVAPDEGRGAGPERDFWLTPGTGADGAGIGTALRWGRERTGLRSAASAGLAAGADGLEAALGLEWQW